MSGRIVNSAAAVTPATAVLYLRVSSTGQVNKGTDPEGYSIPGQREACQRHAEGLGAEVLREYVEPGKTGTTTKRPALQQMLGDLGELKPTYVIVYDLSRVARDDFDSLWLLREIEGQGCKLESTLERVDATPAGKLLYTIMAGVNAFRSRGDAEKVKLGLKRKHATGGTNGKAPIGYLNIRKRELSREFRSVEIDADRAPLVRLAFSSYATGEYSISAITELLDTAGLRTPMTAKRPAAPLARSAVHRMLRDDYYIGLVTYNGEKANGLHPPLIDIETFERVQEVLRGHARSGDRAQKHEHYLKGSIYCGTCGGRLIFTIVTGHGGRYAYFRCFGRHNLRNNCDAPHQRAETIESEVEKFYRDYPWLTADEKTDIRAEVRQYADIKLKGAKREGERAARRLESLKQEQQRLLQLSYRDLVDEDVLAAEQARIRRERAEVSKWARVAERDADEIMRALEEALQLLDDPGTAYRLATPTVRRMLNQAVWQRLWVLDGEVVGAEPTPWVKALMTLARPSKETETRRDSKPQPSPLQAALDRHEAREHLGRRVGGGLGLNDVQVVRPRGLEPPRTNQSTRPSTLRVYQFRHRRVGGEYSPGGLA